MNELSNDNQIKETPPQARRGSFWGEIIRFTFIALIIIVPFRIYVAQPFIVSGASMDPTFGEGEYLIVDQLSKHFESPPRDSVVIFKYPKDTSKFFIKRIIGLPSETVQIRDGVVTIFNQENPKGLVLEENFIAEKNKKADDVTFTLKQDEYFVLGDNRLGSLDSRSWGAVPRDLIIGRPLVRLLPLNQVGLFPGDFSK